MVEYLNEFMTALDQVGIVVGIVLAVPVLWTWYETVWGREARLRRVRAGIRSQPGVRPSILIVDLLPGKDVRATVENYRMQIDGLKGIPQERVFLLQRTKWLGPDDMGTLVADMRLRCAEIIAAGTDTLHLFYAGPTIPAALIGCEFGNACRTLLYQHGQGQYENWGPLRLGA